MLSYPAIPILEDIPGSIGKKEKMFSHERPIKEKRQTKEEGSFLNKKN